MTSVVVAYVHPGEVSGPFHESLIDLLERDKGRLVRGRIALTSGPRIASARNQIVEKFLTMDAEWLWFVDSDMAFPPYTLGRLIAKAHPVHRPIVGGLCFGGRKDTVFPTLYRLVDPATNDGEVIQVIEDFPEDALVKVDATGAACLLIHRNVLQNIRSTFPPPQHWFSESVYKGLEFGEDWVFCLRAGQLGYPIHVHTGTTIGHVKPRIVGIKEFMAQREPALV